MEFKKVVTPSILDGDAHTAEQLLQFIRSEFEVSNSWTDACSVELEKCPYLLLRYDRLSYALSNAHGDLQTTVMLNPYMTQCYHTSCLKKKRKPIRARNLNSIKKFLEHLDTHNDALGLSMQKRFKAVYDDQFTTMKQLDELAASPYSLLQNDEPSAESIDFLKSNLSRNFIDRKFSGTYICHWKNLFIENGIIESTSLSFQEDDALIATFLSYPNPIKDWKFYKTVAFFFLKMYCSNGATSLNLHRGITKYPKFTSNNDEDENMDVLKFFAGINHAGPGLTTIQNWLPSVSYDNEQFHKKYLLCHIRTLARNDSVALSFNGVTRYPVVLGIDEQELNQGTFVENEGVVLHGLKDKITAEEIRKIGLANVPEYISKQNPFITSVREYRVIDMKGLLCSNAYTSFVSGCLKSSACIEHLQHVSELARSCEYCLRNSLKCRYETLDEKCSSCEENGQHCRSAVVFHVLWDMGSSQVKSAKEMPLKLDSGNIELDFLRADKLNIGFGMLHILKAIINKTRNYSLSYQGQNYGIHILRSMKNDDDLAADYLSSMKNSVLVGKDRQSDYLSYMTTSDVVQCSLKQKGSYSLTRVPEPVLTYKDNAKKQKPFVFPVAVECNRNGDVFVLDAGASCVHAFARFSVAKSYIIGSYMKPCLDRYDPAAPLKGKDVKLSNNIQSMAFVEEDLFISDSDRRELSILKLCNLAKNSRKCRVHICKNTKYSSIAPSKHGLLIGLHCAEDQQKQEVQIIKINFPKKDQKYSLFVVKEVLHSITPFFRIRGVFHMNLDDDSFGAIRTRDKKIVFYLEGADFSDQVSEETSRINPRMIKPGQLLALPCDQENIIQSNVEVNDSSVSCSIVGTCDHGQLVPSAVACWGSTILIVGKDQNHFKLQECGHLDFGIQLTGALNLAYHAAAYLPPHGIKDIKERTLPECIAETKILANLLNEMQQEKEAIFPTRSRFSGAEGSAFTQTISCLNSTIDGWETVVKRFEMLHHLHLVDKIRPRSLVNESIIEHSFGFVSLKAGKQLQDMYEYIHNKAKHELDFQLRLTQLPFCQHTKVKLRDKSYQDLDSSVFSKMDMDDFWDIFCDDPRTKKRAEVDVDPADKLVTKQAYLLTKSVPRRSNRSKWKEQSGHAPPLLSANQEDSYILSGDMVFARALNKNFVLLVKKKFALLDENTILDVDVINDKSFSGIFTIKDLFHKSGQIFVVPYTLFEAADNFEDVIFDEVVEEEVESVLIEMGSSSPSFSDEEWSIIPDVETSIDFAVARKRKGTEKDKEVSQTQEKKQKLEDIAVTIVPTHESFYVVKLVRETDGVTKYYVAQNNAPNNIGDLFWMNFMHRLDDSNEFSWMNSDGLVSSNEIVKILSKPVSTSLSSTRRGNYRFNLEEITDFVLE